MTNINTANITFDEMKKRPTEELLNLYNIITGEKIKKFRDRATAERRTWKVIERLAPGEDVRKTIMKEKDSSRPIAKKNNETPGKRSSAEERTIKLLVEKNPKREGFRAFDKFAILMGFDGKTIAEYKAEEGNHPKLDAEKGWPATELRWAVSLGLVKLSSGHSVI